MQQTTRVNPSVETINIGPLGIRFLLTGDDSGGSVSVFEVTVPAGQKLAAPAHKNDAYERSFTESKVFSPGPWTAPRSRWVRVRRCAFQEAPCTASTTSAART